MNGQDRKDLEKFTKFFIYKSIQIIVQSRLGDRLKTKSKFESNGTEWFNLAISDIHEVQHEIKKALSDKPVLPLQPVCVEVSLKTSENEWMILETWCLEWDQKLIDQNVKVRYTVYNRLSILLKSLTCITRLVPAYRISRQQSADSYVMCYRVYVGTPQVNNLGYNYVTKQIGQVSTPLGSLGVTVAFRTRMLLTPGSDAPLLTQCASENHYDLEEKTKCIHRQDSTGSQGNQDEDLCSTILFSTSSSHDGGFSVGGDGDLKKTGVTLTTPSENSSKIDAISTSPFQTALRRGAFAPADSSRPSFAGTGQGGDIIDADGIIPDTPFPDLFHMSLEGESNEAGSGEKGEEPVSPARTPSSPRHPSSPTRPPSHPTSPTHQSQPPGPDPEFVLVELRPPFAEADPKCDIGAFYRNCQNAPQLSCFDRESNLENTVKEIADKLSYYENNQADLESFVNSLQPEEEDDEDISDLEEIGS